MTLPSGYQVVDLGVPPSSIYGMSVAAGINAAGQVILNAGEGALYTAGTLTELKTAAASGINNLGQVVGTIYSPLNGTRHASLSSGGPPQNIDPLSGGSSSASGINDSGQIVGQTVSEFGFNVATYNSVPITAFPYNSTSGFTGIDSAGLAVGNVQTSDQPQQAFLYAPGVGVTYLGIPLGYASISAQAINNAGQVVGNAADGAENTQVFEYSGGAWHNIVSFPGYTNSIAHAVNNADQVVGGLFNPGGGSEHAFLESGGVTVDLNSLLPPGSPFTSLDVAWGINDSGQIVGVGTTTGGRPHAFLLTPSSPAAALPVGNGGYVAGSPGTFSIGNAPGWTVSGGDAGVYVPTASQFPGGLPAGPNPENMYSNGGTISQTLPDALAVGTYTLQVQDGNRADTPFPGYSIEVWAGNNRIAVDNSTVNPAPGTYALSTLTFTGSAFDDSLGKPLQIRLRSLGNQTNFDQVQLTGPDALSNPHPLPVVDGGFEAENFFTPGSFTLGQVPNWTVTGGLAGVYYPTSAQFPNGIPQGHETAYSNGGTISQTLPDALAVGTYSLQVNVGARADTPFPGYAVELWAGNTLLASDNGSASPAPGAFAPVSVNYTALPGDPSLGQPVQIRLRSLGNQTNFDDVRLSGPVGPPAPQPLSVTDAGFEAVSLPSGGFTQGSIPGWSIVGGQAGIYRPTASQFPGQTIEGQNVAYLNSATIAQALDAALAVGTYTFQVDVGSRADAPSGGFDIELRAGTTPLTGFYFVNVPRHIVPQPGSIGTVTLSYTALQTDPNLGKPLVVVLRAYSGQTDFDNVRVTGPDTPTTPRSLAIIDQGFEGNDRGTTTTTLPQGGFTVNQVPGWTVTGGAAGLYRPTGSQFPGGIPEGFQTAYSNGGTISLTLPDYPLAVGTYALTVDIGARADTPFPGYAVELWAGNTLLASDNGSASPAPGTFAPVTVLYTVLPGDPSLGQPLQIRLRSLGNETDFDDVRLTGP